MNSFYGGRPGNPFVIIATFNSKQQMIENFKLGAAYTAVHYDEHVLINTINKNDPDNGKIYRRGYDLNNGLGGAEYIGTIVGPAGKAPHLEMTTQSAVDDMYESQGYDGRYSTGEYVANTNLVPGKDGASFNDTISWSCYSVRDQNGEDTTAYIGFTIPYPVIEFDANSVSSYNAPYAVRTDGKNHPFYEKWTLGIPKGIKGDSINRIWVEKDDSDNHYKIYYTTKDYSENSEGVESAAQELGEYNVIEGVSLNENGTFTVRYSNGQLEETLSWVTEIEVLPDGRLKVKYNTGTEKIIDEASPIKYIKNIQMLDGVNDGKIRVTYNTTVPSDPEDPDSEPRDETEIINSDHPIKFISDIQIGQSPNSQNLPADIIVTYNTGASERFENVLKTISGIEVDNTTGELTVTYNTYHLVPSEEDEEVMERVPDTQSFSGALKSISGISINDGKMQISYNTGDSDTINGIKYIQNVSVNPSGDLVIQYSTLLNNNPEIYETEVIEGILDTPIGIDIDSSSQKLKVEYRSGNEQEIGEPINFIRNIAIDNQGKLLMKFSDPDTEIGTEVTWDGSTWRYVGTVSGQGLGFNANQATATNRYLSGIINTQDQLIFDLNTNQFLSKNITAVTIQSCSIKVYDKNSTDYSTPLASITINQTGSSHTNTVTSNLFGLHCVFDTITSTSIQNTIPVDILIENIQFNFTINDDSSIPADISSRVGRLETTTRQIQQDIAGKQNKINLTSQRALISNNDGEVSVSNITAEKLEYLSGVTSDIQTQISDIQTQINDKQNIINNLTPSRVLVSNSNKGISVSNFTTTQLGYLSNVTSDIQGQINEKGIINTFKNIYPSPDGNGYPISGNLTSGTWKSVHSINLEAGRYLLNGTITFDQTNGNGIRACCFSTGKNDNDKINRFAMAQMPGNANGYSRLKITFAHVTNGAQTLYFNVEQTSGAKLTYDDVGVQVIKLA